MFSPYYFQQQQSSICLRMIQLGFSILHEHFIQVSFAKGQIPCSWLNIRLLLLVNPSKMEDLIMVEILSWHHVGGGKTFKYEK
jgi:hypothetical protein